MHFVEVQLHCMPRPMPSIHPSHSSLSPYEAELMLRVSFMHMLFYLSSVPLSHPHGQHLPLASTRSPSPTWRGGPSDIGVLSGFADTGGIMSSAAALSHSVVVSSALFHFPLPTKSRPRPGKCAAARSLLPAAPLGVALVSPPVDPAGRRV